MFGQGTKLSVERDLVFIGGGHTHALVLKQFGMKPLDGVRLTLISEQTLTPYSGMLPGFVAGHYSYLDAHIDLNRLCQWANVRFIRGTVTGIDADANTVHTTLSDDSGESVAVQYDQLSIDVGSTPDLSVPGAREHAVGVKPVSQFGEIWNNLLQASKETVSGEWGVVGAGAGGVELVLGMAQRLRAHKDLNFHLLYSGDHVLRGYPDKVVSVAEKYLIKNNITLHPDFRVAEVHADGLTATGGKRVTLDKSIWCTGAAAATWLAETGLEVSERGFIAVNEYLQSKSHSNVFAVGDCSDMLSDPRPKAGVYAVRQAPFLADNLRSVLAAHGNGPALKPLKLQTDFLSLLSLGEKTAVGCRGGYTASGRWVWKLKDNIDQKFMRKLNEPGPKMAMAAPAMEVMHCAGCGSKLGPDIIAGNLAELSVHQNDAVTPALGKAEDASLWRVGTGMLAVQSIDGFRSFTEDYSRFGKICVNHALSDLYAMGATPVSAQVWLNLKHAHPRIQKRDHKLLMASITHALNEQHATLAGGHSSEGLETHVALVANGEIAADKTVNKDTVKPGDVLVLTKALGTGLILAADMQAQAPAVATDAAFDSMLQSNRRIGLALHSHNVSAATDVTGFGLIGHLLEMLGSTELVATLKLNNIPLIDGAYGLSSTGFRSTLYPHLQVYLQRCAVSEGADSAMLDVLLDPQTSGGLLIALPQENADSLIKEFPESVIIGGVESSHGSAVTATERIHIS